MSIFSIGDQIHPKTLVGPQDTRNPATMDPYKRNFGTGSADIPTSLHMLDGINSSFCFTATECIFNNREHSVCNRPICFSRKATNKCCKLNNFCGLQMHTVLVLAGSLLDRYLAQLSHSSFVPFLF